MVWQEVKHDSKYDLKINPTAYQFGAPPPVVGYWVLPCQSSEYKTKFACYTKPSWLRRLTLKAFIGWTWENKL